MLGKLQVFKGLRPPKSEASVLTRLFEVRAPSFQTPVFEAFLQFSFLQINHWSRCTEDFAWGWGVARLFRSFTIPLSGWSLSLWKCTFALWPPGVSLSNYLNSRVLQRLHLQGLDCSFFQFLGFRIESARLSRAACRNPCQDESRFGCTAAGSQNWSRSRTGCLASSKARTP